MMALSCGKEIVMIGLAIEGQSASVMDRQKCHGYTALCIALHGKNRMYNDTNKLTQGQRQHCYSITTNKFPLVVHVKNPVLYPGSYKFLYCSTDTFSLVPSVLWCCWLSDRKGIRPVKNWVVGCWHGYLSGARSRLAYGPADATATHCLLLQ